MLNFKNGTDIKTENIIVTIYGEPGIGKTSLALTATNPLILDFDKGVQRSEFKSNATVFNGEYAELHKEMRTFLVALKDYDTLVVDTVDKFVLSIKSYVEKHTNIKHGLQVYGKMKDLFVEFVENVKNTNTNLVLLAHSQEIEEGNAKIKRPSITGGSKEITMTTSDFLGYYSIQNKKRTLDFNPSDFFHGKNSANLEVQKVPNFNHEPNYFQSLIDAMIESMNKLNESQLKAIAEIQEWKLRIDNSKKEELDDIVPELKQIKNNAVKAQVRHIYKKKINEYKEDA